MAELRKGCQTPTKSVTLPYELTYGQDAINLYNETGRKAQEWQEKMLLNILAYQDDGLWVHTKCGYSVPRRNGKNEIVAMRELYGLIKGERILHTAHRTTTSHSASVRLVKLLDDLGYEEVQRVSKKEAYSKHYTYSKQFGLERITLLDSNGTCDFRTRSGKGGLGEGFDTLIIDEAQEYTDDQESALKYVVTDSMNPQTIFCGTPPTAVSSGTVFLNFRKKTLDGETENALWAEWSVDTQVNPRDKEYWYQCNPSLGTIFTERSIADEIGSDEVDFNIQRLGLWLSYSLKSAISEVQWDNLQVDTVPALKSRLFVGIKYGQDGKCAMSIAFKADDGKIFVETIDCKDSRGGNDWIIAFLKKANIENVTVDGASGQALLSDEMKDAKLRRPILPTVKEIINANTLFTNAIEQETICHMGQPSLRLSVTNCEKRNIGSNGGYGYKSLKPDIDISLMDSVILAHWSAVQSKEKVTQKINY